MNPVPSDYQRVINPWMKPREIRAAVKTVTRMMKGKGPDERAELLGWVRPSRDWSRPT